MKELNPLQDLSIFIENNIHILTTPYFTDYSPNQSEKTATQSDKELRQALKNGGLSLKQNEIST